MSLLDNLDKLGKVIDFAVKTEQTAAKVLKYLQKYGYIVKDPNAVTVEEWVAAIRDLQAVAGLSQSGTVNAQTLKVLDWPRCKIQDNLVENSEVLNRWATNKLNFYIAARNTNLSSDLVQKAIIQALTNIENVCGLQFTLVGNPQDANLILGEGRGAKDDFDGPSGTLAWFQLPTTTRYAGQLNGELDLDETWVYPTGRGIKLVNVACHEITHGLGLTHSKVSTALMAPFYSPDIDKPQPNDDIPRLQARYGKPIAAPSQPPVTPSQPPVTPLPNPSQTTTITLQGSISNIIIPGYRITKVD